MYVFLIFGSARWDPGSGRRNCRIVAATVSASVVAVVVVVAAVVSANAARCCRKRRRCRRTSRSVLEALVVKTDRRNKWSGKIKRHLISHTQRERRGRQRIVLRSRNSCSGSDATAAAAAVTAPRVARAALPEGFRVRRAGRSVARPARRR